MAVYKLPGAGTLTLHRKGEVRERGELGIRYRYNVTGTSITGTGRDGTTYRTWITVPDEFDENRIVGAAAAAVGYQVAEERGIDTGTEWDVYAEGFEEDDRETGQDTAAMYRVDGVSHYRMSPYTFDPDSVVFPSIRAVKAGLSRSLRSGISLVSPGDVVDLYPNDADEPSHRIVIGPKGGLTVVQY